MEGAPVAGVGGGSEEKGFGDLDDLAEIELGAPPEPHTLSADPAREPGHDELEAGSFEAGVEPGDDATLEGFQPTALGGFPQDDDDGTVDEEARAGEDAHEREAPRAREEEEEGPGEEPLDPLPTLGGEDALPILGDDEGAEPAAPEPEKEAEAEPLEIDAEALDVDSGELEVGAGPAGAGAEEPGPEADAEPGGAEASEMDAVLDLQAAVQEAAEEAAEEAAAAARAEEEAAGAETEAEDPVEEIGRRTAAGDIDGAMDVARGLIEADPDEVAHRQRLVELAFRKGDDAVMVEVYLGLAAALERAGLSWTPELRGDPLRMSGPVSSEKKGIVKKRVGPL
jgi:hypothetical protein